MFPFKVLEEKFQTIPDKVREAILSTEVNQKLQEIVAKYQLQFDEGEDLTKEIGYVMLGLKSPNDFVKNVQNATDLDEKTSKKIVEEVNERIFKEIKDSLKEVHREETQTEEVEDEDLNEEIQEKMRAELLQEIESPQEKSTALIKQPEQELQKIEQPTEEKTPSSTNKPTFFEKTEKGEEQNQEKKYIIDPYREPIE